MLFSLSFALDLAGQVFDRAGQTPELRAVANQPLTANTAGAVVT